MTGELHTPTEPSLDFESPDGDEKPRKTARFGEYVSATTIESLPMLTGAGPDASKIGTITIPGKGYCAVWHHKNLGLFLVDEN